MTDTCYTHYPCQTKEQYDTKDILKSGKVDTHNGTHLGRLGEGRREGEHENENENYEINANTFFLFFFPFLGLGTTPESYCTIVANILAIRGRLLRSS